MQTNSINLCLSCIYSDACVLTHNQRSVISCSDYNETSESEANFKPTKPVRKVKRKKEQLEMMEA